VWVTAVAAVLLVAGALAYRARIQGDSPSSAPVPQLDTRGVADGAALYQANCSACHGQRGEGSPNWRTPNSDGTFNPPPHDETGHTWHHADGQLFLIVRDGGQIYATAGFKPQMPAFGAQLSDQEIRDVINYLKSLWPAQQRQFQAEVSQRDPFPP
jgi:mono/diheme cytochrome c family protein